MSIKYDMTSPDLDRQIELLKFYPEIMEQHFRPALEHAVTLGADVIEPTIPVGMTGRARSTFKSKVTGKGINLQGDIGWFGSKVKAYYIKFVDAGAAPHDITSRDKKAGFLWFSGHAYRTIHHPGISARGFMAAGFSAIQPVIDAEMAAASNAVVKDLAVP